MTMKEARHHLGLSLSEFAALHQQSTHSIRRWEMPETASGYRKPNGSAVALTEVLLALKGWLEPGDTAARAVERLIPA